MENNKDLFYKLVGEAKQIKLTERERNSLILAVDTFVAKNPIRKQEDPITQPSGSQPIKSPFFKQDWFFAFSQRSHNYYLAGALTLLAIFGTGTSFAAQAALPGDILYPVKVNILEEVKAVFLPSALKPEYEIQRVQTRISEVKTLAEQDRLSDDIKVSVAAQIDSHISTVKKDISDLKQKGDIKHVLATSASLESALDESQNQIESLAKEEGVVKVAFMKDIIEDKKEDVVKDREVIEDQIYTQKTNDENTLEIAKAKFEATQKNLAIIEAKLAEVDVQKVETGAEVAKALSVQTDIALSATSAKLAAPASESVSTPTPTVQELVAQAQELLMQGKEKMDNKEYNEAFRIFREANYLTQVIDFRIGEDVDIGSELDSLLNDINVSDSGVEDSLQADVHSALEKELDVQ